MRSNFSMIATSLLVAAVVAACSSTAAPATSTPGVATTTPPAATQVATEAPASPSAAATAAASAATSGNTVEAKTVGTIGTALVAGSTGMTVYTFTQDVKGNGKSACTGGCASTWPPLTVPNGTKPTAGTGATGTLATITRADGALQVTYNGLPLYLFKNDHAPGDANGVYTGWEAVKP